MSRSGRTLLIVLLALQVSPDVLGFSLSVSPGQRARGPRAAGGRRMASVAASLAVRMKAGDSAYDTPVDLVNEASEAPKVAVPAFRSQEPDAPATIAEVEQKQQQQTASSQPNVIEQRAVAPAAGGSLAYDGAVSAGSMGLQVVEGLAVLAAIPAILVAVNKQTERQERETKNQARAEELAASRNAKQNEKAVYAVQAAIDRKEKQDAIAQRIEAARVEEERQENVRRMVLEAQVEKQEKDAVLAKEAAEQEAREKAESEARRERSRKERAERMAAQEAQQAAESKAKAEAEARAAAEAEALAKVEAETKAREEAEAKAKGEAEERAIAEAKAAKEVAEAEAKAKQEAEERVVAEAKAAKEAAEAEAKAKEEARAAAEAEALAKAEVEERAKREAEAKEKREAEAKEKREAEEKAVAEAKAAKEAAQAEAKAKAEAEAQAKAETEAKAQREAEERAAAEAKAAKEAAQAEVEARAKAEAKAKREAEERAAKEAAEIEAKTKMEAQREAEEKAAAEARVAAEAKARAEEEAKAATEARAEAEAKVQREAEERAVAEAKARAEEEAKAAAEAEAAAKAAAAEEARATAQAAVEAKVNAESKKKSEAMSATTMTEKQKYEADETQRAAEIAAQISSSGALSTPDTRFAKSYVLGAWGKEKRPSSPDARDAPVPSAAPVAVRGLPSPDSATEAAAKSYKKSYSIGAWGQLTRTGEDTDQPAAKSAEEGKPMQTTMTAKQKRETSEAQRAAEIAAQASLSRPTSTPAMRFIRSYVLGAWGQDERPASSDPGAAPVPSATQDVGVGSRGPESTAEAAAKANKRYNIGAWDQPEKAKEAAVDQPAKELLEKVAPKPEAARAIVAASEERRKARADAGRALLKARKNNIAKLDVLATLDKMSIDALTDFAQEVGVTATTQNFKVLRTVVIKKLEARGAWAEIAPDVKRAASRFIVSKNATPA